jgi:hypothetical protein
VVQYAFKLEADEFFGKTINRSHQKFVRLMGVMETAGVRWLVLSSGNFRTAQRWHILRK